MLQAYALQHLIQKRYDAECEIIDFSNSEQKRMYSIVIKPRRVKDFFRNILNIMFYRQIQRHNKDYSKFKKNNLNLSKIQYSSLQELESEDLKYDIYIAGSDQVWNINAQDFDDAYFLPFVKNRKKIAYAVSLGATNPNSSKEKEKYSRYIKEFNGISVRERNAQKWIQSLIDRDVNICVDPTLLLPADSWKQITGKREVNGKYIFWYTMIYKKELCEIVQKISEKYGMPVYVIDAKEWSRRALYLRGIKLAHNGGPSSYLSLVKNAEIVLTSSFHGTVFCNVFKKNFWYINIHDKDTNDDRASFLLSQLGLSDRYIRKNEVLETDLTVSPVYPEEPPINSTVQKSLEFLDSFCI